jgi:hypothetical protein
VTATNTTTATIRAYSAIFSPASSLMTILPS